MESLAPYIEALIFASDKSLTAQEITDLLNASAEFKDEKVVQEDIEAALQEVAQKYSHELYPFEIVQSGGGWQFLTKKKYYKTVAQLTGEKFLKRLSAASLETLAIIAYKQPITKGEIESIRGVSSDYSIQKLLEKELIVISGRNEDLPGKPLLYTTSKSFMDYFGINSPEELPKIKEVLPDQAVQPTAVQSEVTEESIDSSATDNEVPLVVRGNGELVEEPLVVNEDTEAVDPADAIHTENLDEPS
ncbi:MAG: SMC-Scp complex subunit ScpB [Williamsia sp.]|nr:SMC-Scp complex subunit ScpB [Williamsia sp.]